MTVPGTCHILIITHDTGGTPFVFFGGHLTTTFLLSMMLMPFSGVANR